MMQRDNPQEQFRRGNALAAVMDTLISGRRVARERAAIVARRDKPDLIVGDHDKEFTSNAMLKWTQATGVA